MIDHGRPTAPDPRADAPDASLRSKSLEELVGQEAALGTPAERTYN